MKYLKNVIKAFLFLGYLIPGLLTQSCTNDPYLIEELDQVCFESEVYPLINASCGTVGCHSGNGQNSEFDASSYESIMKAVKPGDARKSLLYEVLTSLNGDLMPPNNPLSKEQRTLIQVWIEQGAKNTTCPSTTEPDTNKIDYTDSICFVQDIQPLIASSCATTNCHDDITKEAGYVLTDYNNITQHDDAVRPFMPEESKIYKVLNESGDDRMPPMPLPPLSEENKELIRKWIAEGALNSDCPSNSCDTLQPISFAEQIWPVVNRSCVGCHNVSNSNGGILLDSYDAIKNVADNQRNGMSVLVGVIRKETGFAPMPPTGQLEECAIRQIELWIEQGEQNN